MDEIRVVLDTNVLISATLSFIANRSKSLPLQVVELLVNQNADSPTLLLSDDIFQEYDRVLHDRKFRFESAIVDVMLDILEDVAAWVAPVRSIRRRTLTPRDPDDAIFLECVTAGDADYLITGNKADFPDEPWIVTPREFLDLEYN